MLPEQMANSVEVTFATPEAEIEGGVCLALAIGGIILEFWTLVKRLELWDFVGLGVKREA